MWPDRVSNPGPLTYESGALPIALRGPAILGRRSSKIRSVENTILWENSGREYKNGRVKIRKDFEYCGGCKMACLALQSLSFAKMFIGWTRMKKHIITAYPKHIKHREKLYV